MINASALNLIKQFEGCKLTAYADAVNVPTIGYGHTGSDVTAKDIGRKTITQAQAEALLLADIAKFEKGVAALVKVPLTENQRGALVAFTFNLGLGNFGGSTLLKKVNAKEFTDAAGEFARWNKAGGKILPGLTKRRAAEAALFSRQ